MLQFFFLHMLIPNLRLGMLCSNWLIAEKRQPLIITFFKRQLGARGASFGASPLCRLLHRPCVLATPPVCAVNKVKQQGPPAAHNTQCTHTHSTVATRASARLAVGTRTVWFFFFYEWGWQFWVWRLTLILFINMRLVELVLLTIICLFIHWSSRIVW